MAYSIYIQWFEFVGYWNKAVSFPITFSTSCFSIATCPSGGSGWKDNTNPLPISTYASNAGAFINEDNIITASGFTTCGCQRNKYIAVGY